MRRHNLSCAVDADLFDQLDRLADREGESRSEIVNQLLRDGLAHRQEQAVVEDARTAATATATLTCLYVAANLLLANLYALGIG